MNTTIPSAEDLSVRLRSLRLAELRVLAERSGVPYRTLINIRLGITPNPGIETVRKFLPLLPAVNTELTQGVAHG